ncbi:MAG TPA: 5-(carboxyamino)imidazole ribonucleotide synthase [Jiangellaceae bacterium]|nr:5-(carboxyamino)imidazole ribonucleotide synthase [Jiangellaceae bacterium]
MTQPAAIALGVRLAVLAARPDDAAAQVVPATTVGDEKALADLRRFAEQCDVITFDHEHVPTSHLRSLETAGVVVRPAPEALIHAQDKAVMRSRLTAAGIPCPRHRIVSGPADVAAFSAELAGDSPSGELSGQGAASAQAGDLSGLTTQVVLKTTRGGYDGKGVWIVRSFDEAAEPFRASVPVLAEELIDFPRELAAVVARSPSGQAVAYPVVESVQRDGICVEVVAPAPSLPDRLAVEAQRLALAVAAELDVVGVLAVELFETRDGRLLVNELAMRPHNTAHWSIDGAVTSQFENHLRAVLDLPLGSPAAHAPYAVMVNVFGGELREVYSAYRHCMSRDPALKIHWYGKKVRPGRKVGHVTVLGDDVEDLRERARHAAGYLRGDVDE